jgi:YVTN family beta-propeller protein
MKNVTLYVTNFANFNATANSSGSSISIVDVLLDGEVRVFVNETTIFYPYGIILSPDSKLAYVMSSSGGEGLQDQYILIIDTTLNQIVSAIDIQPVVPANNYGVALEVNANGSKLYMSAQVFPYDTAPSIILVFNITNNGLGLAFLYTITIGSPSLGSDEFAMVSEGGVLYCTDYGNDAVVVINMTTDTVTKSLGVPGEPTVLALQPNSTAASLVYTCAANAPEIFIVDPILGNFSVLVVNASSVEAIDISSDGVYLLAVTDDDYLFFFNSSAPYNFVNKTPVGNTPLFIFVLEDDMHLVFVTNFFDNTISVVNTSTFSVIETIPYCLGTLPYYMVGVSRRSGLPLLDCYPTPTPTSTPIPTPTSTPIPTPTSTSIATPPTNLALILGLSLGLGIPCVCCACCLIIVFPLDPRRRRRHHHHHRDTRRQTM